MFLNQLSNHEKEAFISLSIHAAKANGIFEEEERILIEEYCREMAIEKPDLKSTMTLEEVEVVFSKSEHHIKKIVLLEIFGLVYSDGQYDSEEKGFINDFVQEIGLGTEEAEKLQKLIIKYLEVLKEISVAVE